MSPINIRPEQPEEFAKIYDLVKIAFETAKVSNGDEQNFVDRLRAGEGYLAELALVAEKDGELLGHIMLTRKAIQTVKGDFEMLLLAPIAIVHAHRSQGIGRALIQAAFGRARASGFQSVLLVGDPAYYERFGFKPTTSFGIANRDGIPDRFVMACELADGALAGVSGSVSFYP